MKAANSFLPGGRKPSKFKYFMFTESCAFNLLAALVLEVAEVKLPWHCQDAAAAPANLSPWVKQQQNQSDTTNRDNQPAKEAFSHNFRQILVQKKKMHM